MVSVSEYKEERCCVYKREFYSVRDNGAIKRFSKNGKRKRKWDDVWTFGKKYSRTGYMLFAGQKVHRIVATAFHGASPGLNHVVDHIDTNRANNRPENLRWVTKLENALKNPITRHRIECVCGSVEAFLKNPSLLKNSKDPSIAWMRTVSEKEAAECKKNLEKWARDDNSMPKGGEIGNWVYQNPKIREKLLKPVKFDDSSPMDSFPIKDDFPLEHYNHTYEDVPANEFVEEKTENAPFLYESLTANAVQENWKTPTDFVRCPKDVLSLDVYKSSLKKGAVFCVNRYGSSIVKSYALSDDGLALRVGTYTKDNYIKRWALAEIYIDNDKYVHKSVRTYFYRKGMQKELALLQGRNWTGGEVFDEFC